MTLPSASTAPDLHDRALEAAAAIRAASPDRPRVGVVLGSGLGGFAEEVETVATLS